MANNNKLKKEEKWKVAAMNIGTGGAVHIGASSEKLTKDVGKAAGIQSTSDAKTKANEAQAVTDAEEATRLSTEKEAEDKKKKRMNIFRAEEGEVAVGRNRSAIFGN